MKLDLTDMLYALSFAMEKVETELLGVDTGHGRRVTYLSILMGKEAGFHEMELRDFVGCCLLHDNALSEFIHDELTRNTISDPVEAGQDEEKPNFYRDHSVVGEQNIRLLPFRTDVKNIVLFHHENADGSGALGMTSSDTPLKAQILHLADMVDMRYRMDPETATAADLQAMHEWVESKVDVFFSRQAADLFLRAVTYETLAALQGKDLLSCFHEEFDKEVLDYSHEEVRNIARLFAKVVDYKSRFTQNHSTGVAEKAEIMAHYYGFDDEKATRFYFAGAMHDIGKLAVGNSILEKPGKLTDGEFTKMKDHAAATYSILSRIEDIPDIVEWASNHHEKLNGRGYPRRLTAEQLSFEDQLMACIDIYQALTEKRPYKDGMPHEKAISIMQGMVDKGELNGSIVRDMDAVMAAG